MPAPFGQPLAEDEAVIAEAQAIFDERVALFVDARRVERARMARPFGLDHVIGLDSGKRRHQMCFSTSGMS